MRHMKCSVGASGGFLNPNPCHQRDVGERGVRCCSTVQETLWFRFSDALIHPKHAEASSVSKINNREVSLPAVENHKNFIHHKQTKTQLHL